MTEQATIADKMRDNHAKTVAAVQLAHKLANVRDTVGVFAAMSDAVKAAVSSAGTAAAVIEVVAGQRDEALAEAARLREIVPKWKSDSEGDWTLELAGKSHAAVLGGAYCYGDLWRPFINNVVLEDRFTSASQAQRAVEAMLGLPECEVCGEP